MRIEDVDSAAWECRCPEGAAESAVLVRNAACRASLAVSDWDEVTSRVVCCIGLVGRVAIFDRFGWGAADAPELLPVPLLGSEGAPAMLCCGDIKTDVLDDVTLDVRRG